MQQFKSQYARALLHEHRPNVYAYFLEQIGLAPNDTNAMLVDKAYVELVELGLMEQSSNQIVMPYHGAVPRRPFKLTADGLKAKRCLQTDENS